MDSGLIILLIIAGILLMATLACFLVRYYKTVNADEIEVELDEEIIELKASKIEEPLDDNEEVV
ncbi:MAG: hypothetical protein E7342_04645 [Clostridiales bacterium]|nr:hypothetical protein [Clostridiales bacterium]